MYKEQRRKVKDLVKTAKRQSWEEFGQRMEKNYKENQKLFYRALKNMRKEKQCPLKFIKDKEGKILTEEKEIMERWKEYFNDLLNGNGNEDSSWSSEEREETGGEGEQEEGEDLRINEMQLAIKQLKNGKAQGHDGIAPEMIKNLGKKAGNFLFKIMVEAWRTKKVPRDWEVAVIIPIFKKGDNRECSNHRGISLLSVPGKVFSKILETRLRKEVEAKLEEAQCGFRPNRSTQDLIFTVRMASAKLLEKNKTLHAAFIDLKQAFDRVPRSKLWKVLKEYGVSKSLCSSIMSLYKNCRNYVRTGNVRSAEFTTRQGVRQGCSLSPLLFIVYLDHIMKLCHEKIKKLTVGNYLMRPVRFSDLAFADDLIVVASSEQNLQHNINVWVEELKEKGMEVNVDKTKTMVISRNEERHCIMVDSKPLEQVTKFKYLGSIISSDGKMEEEITERIGTAGRLFNAIRTNFLNKKEISKGTKLAVYKSTFIPTLTYGCESWVLTERTKSRIQATEMRYLRKVEDKTRRDRIRNTAIRKVLNMKPLEKTIQEYQLRWFGHVHRMSTDRLPRLMREVRVEGRKARGRPRKTWEEGIREALQERGLSVREAVAITGDRSRWRFLVSSTPHGTRGPD
ncbi:LINE-1 retrotransposable element ORF2 protein [Anabrus simplex]|uniref:LINE-1 retrotransposable element ORF2 protein n=1 Tax=Anabrus simplex TaxID=316456 RepID=UPI0035A28787